MDTVDLVESAGEAMADRLLIHYRLDLAQRGTRWACTQTSICKIDDGGWPPSTCSAQASARSR
jgi:hypothetical protein